MKNETLGRVFSRYRKAEGKEIKQVENDIKISRRVIQLIEADDYEKLPDEVYLKHIIHFTICEPFIEVRKCIPYENRLGSNKTLLLQP